jgi:chromosome segregation ATPase
MADTAGPAREPGLEPRVARLETDVAEIKSTLNRLAPRIDGMYGCLTAKLPELATKAELIQLRSETTTGLTDLRTELKTETADLRTQLVDLRTEIRTEAADLRAELRAETTSLRAELRAETTSLRAELKAEGADLRSEMAKLRTEILRRPTRRQSIFDIFAVVGPIGAILTIAAHFAH